MLVAAAVLVIRVAAVALVILAVVLVLAMLAARALVAAAGAVRSLSTGQRWLWLPVGRVDHIHHMDMAVRVAQLPEVAAG